MAQVSGNPPYFTLLGRASSDILKVCMSCAVLFRDLQSCH